MHAGLPLRPGTYPYKRLKPGAKDYIEKIIKRLPPTRERELMLALLSKLKAPGTISLRYATIEESALEIFQNKELCNLIQVLSLLYTDDRIIHEYSKKIILLSEYTLIDLKKFKYWFCNTNSKDGWTVEDKYDHKVLLESIPATKAAYAQLIEDVYNLESRSLLITRLRLPLRPSDRQNQFTQAVDSELSQLSYSQQTGNRKDVRDCSLNLKNLIGVIEQAKVGYEVPIEKHSDDQFNVQPTYKQSIGGDN